MAAQHAPPQAPTVMRAVVVDGMKRPLDVRERIPARARLHQRHRARRDTTRASNGDVFDRAQACAATFSAATASSVLPVASSSSMYRVAATAAVVASPTAFEIWRTYWLRTSPAAYTPGIFVYMRSFVTRNPNGSFSNSLPKILVLGAKP